MSSFQTLAQEVQQSDRCHMCGGCVTFCTAINYGALEIGEDGFPRYKDRNSCLECGICYMLCPEVEELDVEINSLANWEEPAGKIISSSILRARDRQVLDRATDGGAVTAILLHLMESGRIDGAVVSRNKGLFNREPMLARTSEQILECCGSYFDVSHGTYHYGAQYSTYSPSVQALGEVKNQGFRSIAFVGTPCQVRTVRKMQALGVVPADAIYCVLGLFCAGNFEFDDNSRKRLEKTGEFSWGEVKKINVTDKVYIYMQDGSIHALPLDELDFIKRRACNYCHDYSAELADLSFGGVGSDDGWTTVLTRSPLGMEILRYAERNSLERLGMQDPDTQNQRSLLDAEIQDLKSRMQHLQYRRLENPEASAHGYQEMLERLKYLQKQKQKLQPAKQRPEQHALNSCLEVVLEKCRQKKGQIPQSRSRTVAATAAG